MPNFYDLIPSQLNMYLMVKFSPHKQIVQIPTSFAIDKDIDFDLLTKALNIEYQRNDSLRLRFKQTKGKLKQYFLNSYRVDSVPILHFSSAEEQDAFFSKDAQTPVRFLKDEILRIYFFVAHDGTQEYWSCPSCGRLFSDEACTAMIEESAIALEKLVDATGKTDEELVALDAVVKAVAPDGSAKAFDNVKDGYVEAKKWTEVGGSLVLLKDFTQEDIYTLTGTQNEGNTGYLTASQLPTAASYDNAADVPEMPTKGFWFDLGGHTLTMISNRSMYYVASTGYVNIKNGYLIFQSDSRGECTMYGMITCGWTGNQPGADGAIYTPTINLYDVECFSLTALNTKEKTKNSNAAIVGSCILNTTVNIRNSIVIAANDEPAIELYQPKGTNAASLAILQSEGAHNAVNVVSSLVGSLDSTKAAITLGDHSSAPNGGLENVAYSLTVTADKDTTFFGNRAVRDRTAGALRRRVVHRSLPADRTGSGQILRQLAFLQAVRRRCGNRRGDPDGRREYRLLLERRRRLLVCRVLRQPEG